MCSYYPIFINLENKPVLIVGGGTVAYRKVQTLLEYGAQIRIISPEVGPQLEELIDSKQCLWIPREYTEGDIQDVVIVFSCTDKEEINARVAKEAQTKNTLINVVDDPEKCSFIVPSIMRRGNLSIAVSTAGSSPKVASQIRQELEELYGHEIEIYLQLLKTWRIEAKNTLPLDKRLLFWEKVTDGEVLLNIKNGQLDQAKEVIENCFRSLLA